MKRLPIFSTFLVLVAVAIMVGLGFWQLDRARQKEALIARFEQNVRAPRFELTRGVDLAANLMRPMVVDCTRGSAARLAGAGRYGFRVIADCNSPALAQPLAVQLGTVRQPEKAPAWSGGRVTGYIANAPDARSLVRILFDHRPAAPMIVADPPLMGLAANPGPDLSEIPNNHRSYAVQWFSFAGIALIVYGLALRGRMRRR